MAGRRQKPRQALVDRRPERGALVVLPARKKERPPALPRVNWPNGQSWHPVARARWREMWSSDVARTWDRAGELSALGRYIRSLDRWLKYDELVLRSPMVKGSMGQLRENPLASRMAVLSGELRVFEEKFGLTPLDRMRLGIELGGAAQGIKTASELLAEFATDPDEYALPDDWELANG